MEPYFVCVVGAGMIGSAAARYLSERHGSRILLIGPDEPQNRAETDIFGSHYDEGRITRILDADPTFGLLAKKSIERYRDLERLAGISFFWEDGFLLVGVKDGSLLRRTDDVASGFSLPYEKLCGNDLERKFPYLRFSEGLEGMYTSENSGHISPRALVKAQLKLASQNGCVIVKDIVKSVNILDGGEQMVEVITDSGQVFCTKRVLLATGAFTECRQLLPKKLLPAMRLKYTTVLKIEIEEEEVQRLRAMPSIVLKRDFRSPLGEILSHNYILPPVRYPNGKYYLKIGHDSEPGGGPGCPEDITNWFRSHGDKELAEKMVQIMKDIIPGLDIAGWETDTCIINHTATGRLYIDMIMPEVGVALGGSGAAAKSSDEIGRIAALMVEKGQWNYNDLPARLFKYRTKEASKL